MSGQGVPAWPTPESEGGLNDCCYWMTAPLLNVCSVTEWLLRYWMTAVTEWLLLLNDCSVCLKIQLIDKWRLVTDRQAQNVSHPDTKVQPLAYSDTPATQKDEAAGLLVVRQLDSQPIITTGCTDIAHLNPKSYVDHTNDTSHFELILFEFQSSALTRCTKTKFYKFEIQTDEVPVEVRSSVHVTSYHKHISLLSSSFPFFLVSFSLLFFFSFFRCWNLKINGFRLTECLKHHPTKTNNLRSKPSSLCLVSSTALLN
jgi:hypothetical protein